MEGKKRGPSRCEGSGQGQDIWTKDSIAKPAELCKEAPPEDWWTRLDAAHKAEAEQRDREWAQALARLSGGAAVCLTNGWVHRGGR